jgi:hypothetical protein
MIIHCFNPLHKIKKFISLFLPRKESPNILTFLTEHQMQMYDLIKHKAFQRSEYHDCIHSMYTKTYDFKNNTMTFELLEQTSLEDAMNRIVSILHNMYNVEEYEEVMEMLTSIKHPDMIKYIFSLWRYLEIIFSHSSNTWQKSFAMMHQYLAELPDTSLAYITPEDILNLSRTTQNEDGNKDIQLVYLKVMIDYKVDITQKIELIKTLTYDTDIYSENLAFLNQEYDRLLSLILPKVLENTKSVPVSQHDNTVM